ncbi:Rap1a/Tai family immunity protein [Caballeronia sp. GAWG1-5s-s]|uniref:Rap1a/Tai family immunity protein n=1 Tax=Caballeronia sp. GAWG1-5s-s TaxID=2921743 RepID=UPI00202952DC|nr:Rap1a/Tai family immunity protein [Caballeronia sp. GAWG1-5s-s]
MKRALSLAASLALCVATAAHAQSAPTPGASDPSFSAWSLAQQCGQKGDNAAQGQCVGAVRGIVRGYQYGVLFLSQRASMPANETRRVSLCLTDTTVSSIVDDFLSDAKQVSEADLRRTPAEVAVLGSVHAHHACS